MSVFAFTPSLSLHSSTEFLPIVRRCPTNDSSCSLSFSTTSPSLTHTTWKCATELPNTAKECAENFLTQRAVQQTIFCSFMLRDETTARWLEAFQNHIGIYDLHACNALQLASRDYLISLFRAPRESLVIKKPIQGRTNNKNPYIKRRYFTYDIQVIPSKIARRVLEARVQIADELCEDLACIPSDNIRLREMYRRFTLTKQIRAEQDLPVAAERGGSPYRVATFDLARNFTLLLSLSAVSRRANKPSDTRWLSNVRDQYDAQLLAPIQGEQGVADKVVTYLFDNVPSVSAYGHFFDPIAIAERVLDERAHVANEWIEYFKSVRDEHDDIERLLETEMEI